MLKCQFSWVTEHAFFTSHYSSLISIQHWHHLYPCLQLNRPNRLYKEQWVIYWNNDNLIFIYTVIYLGLRNIIIMIIVTTVVISFSYYFDSSFSDRWAFCMSSILSSSFQNFFLFGDQASLILSPCGPLHPSTPLPISPLGFAFWWSWPGRVHSDWWQVSTNPKVDWVLSGPRLLLDFLERR